MEDDSTKSDNSGADSKVVLVLGMHRSGTSAIAAGLQQLGVVMGTSLYRGDEWNPKGYFEEKKFVEFNTRLLDMAGLRWDSAYPFPDSAASRWAPQRTAAYDLVDEVFGDTRVWGFKDPRMCLLSAFWSETFRSRGLTPSLLLMLRDPAEVALSLNRRDGIAVERAGWLWFNHLLGSLDYLQEHSDTHLIDFSDLLHAPAEVMRGLAKWIGISVSEHLVESFASDFISPGLANGKGTAKPPMHPLIISAYTFWRSVASNGMSPNIALQTPEWLSIKRSFEVEIKPKLQAVQNFFAADRQLTVMDSRLIELSDALQVTEELALKRLAELTSQESQLKRTLDALAYAEKLAFERLERIGELEPQLKLTSDGLAFAENLALTRQATIERLEKEFTHAAVIKGYVVPATDEADSDTNKDETSK